MPTPEHIPALKVRQWLDTWDEVQFDPHNHRRQPPKHFYVISLPATLLRSLSGIYRRDADEPSARKHDLASQRRHNEERSEEIAEYVKRGFPWSGLTKAQRKSKDFSDLVKPGWLTTAIVVNILQAEDEREGRVVHQNDLITIEEPKNGSPRLNLPSSYMEGDWEPKGIPPIEVIDGQHRLWSFDSDDEVDGDFDLPVVAFAGLDLSWQAYLFYTINIKPTKINTSLAFDLYPLLRTEDWLEKFAGPAVYRESRAQELTEALWSYRDSPWRDRIDMLGNRGRSQVTQAAWIRSLLSTLVKSWEGPGVKIGGLFGAPVGANETVLPWTRAQQAAFLVYLWTALAKEIAEEDRPWTAALREAELGGSGDPAFSGKATLLNTDQGVRGVLAVFNDLSYVASDTLDLFSWQEDTPSDATSDIGISSALATLENTTLARFLTVLSERLAHYDWRTSSAPGVTEAERESKARFRGGTGYRELRIELLRHVASGKGDVADVANRVLDILLPA